jgi:CRISPR-associated endonuclease Cas1
MTSMKRTPAASGAPEPPAGQGHHKRRTGTAVSPVPDGTIAEIISDPLSPEDVADASDARRLAYGDPHRAAPDGVVVIDGFGVRLGVERGCLVVHDGAGPDRRQRVFDRADPPSHVLVLAQSGSLSLDSSRWLSDLGVPLLHLAPNAEHTFLAAPPRRGIDAALLRAQFRAAEGEVGVELARQILALKLDRQAEVAELLDAPKVAKALQGLAAETQFSGTLQACLLHEANGGRRYWPAWQGVAPRFRSRDLGRVPPRWQQGFATRRGLLPQGNRHAREPVGCLLNLGYRLGELAVTRGLLAVGLSPFLGIWHQDSQDTATFSLDVLEALRPLIDAFVLAVMQDHIFAKVDFVERRDDGALRLSMVKSHEIVHALMPACDRWAAPVVEQARHLIEDGVRGKRHRGATTLTGRRHREAIAKRFGREVGNSDAVLVRAVCGCGAITRPDVGRCVACRESGTPYRPRDRRKPREVGRPAVCERCGGPVPTPKDDYSSQRRYCSDRCAEAGRREAARASQTNRYSWERRVVPLGDTERQRFLSQLVPKLQDPNVSTRAVTEATGVSARTVRAWRCGRAPHERHWSALAKLVGIDDPFDGASENGNIWHEELRARLANLPTKEVAETAGASRSAVQRWTSGRRRPSPAFLPTLAELVGMSLEGGEVETPQ